MKVQINVSQKFKLVNGKDVPDAEEGDGGVLTLKKVAVNALLSPYEDEKTLSGEKKLKRWKLAQRIQDAEGEVSLATEEVVLVKELVAKWGATLISAQAWEMLEGPIDKPE